MTRELLLASVVGLWVASTPNVQGSEDQQRSVLVSEADLSQASRFADDFIQRLRGSLEVARLVDEWFVPEARWFPYGGRTFGVEEYERDRLLSSKDYGPLLDFFHIFMLSQLARVSADELLNGTARDDLTFEELMSPEEMRQLRNQPQLLRYLKFVVGDGGRDAAPFKTIDEFRSITKDLEPLVGMMRQSLNERPQWRSNLKAVLANADYPPSAYACRNEVCFGLPEGALVFTVAEFPFMLSLTKRGGVFRIVSIDLFSR